MSKFGVGSVVKVVNPSEGSFTGTAWQALTRAGFVVTIARVKPEDEISGDFEYGCNLEGLDIGFRAEELVWHGTEFTAEIGVILDDARACDGCPFLLTSVCCVCGPKCQYDLDWEIEEYYDCVPELNGKHRRPKECIKEFD